ncbi:TetR/AcrR family transcriptional regulator [Nocardia gamkensis]|uniref:TetR/AcrR family transcriptional regulator n=1 Tax=Nocardia gamkensis TaxID=352869 RepID=UPI0033EF1584
MKSTTESGRPTQSQRREAARAAILDAAIELLAEGGYAHMTLAEVGERAGYSRSLATHYYGSKPKLLAEIIDYVRTGARRESGRSGRRGLAVIEAEVADIFDGLAAHPSWVRAYVIIAHEAATALPEVLPAIHEQNIALRARIESALHEAIELGEAPGDLDVESTTFAIAAMVRGALWEFYTDRSFNSEACRQAVLQYIRGLARGGPVATRTNTT